MKKIYFLFLMTLLPLLASADAVKIGSIYYNLYAEDKTAEVTMNPNEYSGKVVIPNTVTYNNIVYKVTSIGDCAFYGCSGLTSVTIPDGVTSIGDYAFYDCSGLTSVKIPKSVTSIGHDAFIRCIGLTSITIPNSVISIGDCAFMNCRGLTSVTIDYGVNSIGNFAFYGCKGLTSVTIPNSVTYIGGFAFYGCSLTSIIIPSSVTSIGKDAFDYTPWYDNQPDGVVYIGKILYKYKGTMPDGTKISIKKGTLGFAEAAFLDCNGLISVTIPNSVTYISVSAFYGCSGLTSVTIPSSVTSIGESAFKGCSGLTSVTIPNSVTSIGGGAFSGCKALTNVYCYAEAVPTTQSYSFDTSYIPNVTLHVPTGSVDAYKAVEPWNKFKEIVGTTAKVKLNKTKATLEKGNTLTLKATVTPSTLPDKGVTWKSSNTKVATVTSGGKVKGIKAGTATITCTSNITGAKATCKVTVFEGSVTLDKTEVTLQKGKTVKLTPTVLPATLEDKSVTWTSSNTKVATVTTAGKVKGVKAGTATITCTSNATGLNATCKVTVIIGTVTLNKTEAIIEKGKTTTLKATLTPTDLEDKSVTWKSSDKSIATVTSKGKVKGIGYGTATITCTSNATGVSATCQVTVGKVVISMSEFSIKKSRTNVLTATVYPSTLSDKSVTWTSSDTKVATVTSSGKVKGIAAGTATITCTSVATGLKGTCTVTVLATSESRSVEGYDDTTGIENLEEAPALAEPYDVYDLSGRKVLNQTTSLDGLPAGVYIVNGKKVLKK